MNYVKPKMRPATKWPGGQSYSARRIIAHFKQHDRYLEPYAGGASVLLNKPDCGDEWLGDTHGGLINLFRVVQDPLLFPVFHDQLCRVRYEQGVFELAQMTSGGDLAVVPSPPSVRDALLFLIVNRMSSNGMGDRFAWSTRERGGRPGDLNAWETIKPELVRTHERLRGVRAFHGPALELLRAQDSPQTLVYLDPPFPHNTRTVVDMYGPHEMSPLQHTELLQWAMGCRSMVYITTYPNELYGRLLGGAGWDCDRWELPNNMGMGKVKQRRVVELWFNR